MEIVVKREELNAKLKEIFAGNILSQCAQQNLNEEETNAHLVLNRKKIQQDADNIANIVFRAYGINPEVTVESAE